MRTVPGERSDLAFNLSFEFRAGLIMKIIMVTTKNAATSMTQPSNRS